MREVLLAAADRTGTVRIIWEVNILEKLAIKHWVTDKDVLDVFRNWEILKSVEEKGRSYRYVIEGRNSSGEWMRDVVEVRTEPEKVVIPISCFRCIKTRPRK